MSSSSPCTPRALKRLSQKRTVAPHRPMRAATSGALRPSATACCTICARRTNPAPSVRERVMCASRSASPSSKARTRMVIGMPPANPLPTRTCQVMQSRKALTGRTTKPRSAEQLADLQPLAAHLDQPVVAEQGDAAVPVTAGRLLAEC
jgi:hypothetical protein